MLFKPKTINTILNYVKQEIDLTTEKVFREKGDDLQKECFFLLVEKYLEENPDDIGLNEFKFDAFTQSILSNDPAIKSRTLADILSNALSNTMLNEKTSKKWSSTVRKKTNHLVEIKGEVNQDSRSNDLKFTFDQELKELVKQFKVLYLIDNDLHSLIHDFFKLCYELINTDNNHMELEGVSAVVIAPCLFNCIFHSKNTINPKNMIWYYQVFQEVAKEILMKPDFFNITGYMLSSLITDNNSDALEYVLTNKPDLVNARGIQDRTLLYTAVLKKKDKIITLLLEKKADTSLVNRNNETALDLALKKEDRNIISLLKEKDDLKKQSYGRFLNKDSQKSVDESMDTSKIKPKF